MNQLIKSLTRDEIFAYPTEGIWGLGASTRHAELAHNLSRLKHRAADQPLICVTSEEEHVRRWLCSSTLSQEQLDFYNSHKNLFITFLLPALSCVPQHCLYKGKVALRLTRHPVIKLLCAHFDEPIFSTSANLTKQEALSSPQAIKDTFPFIKIIEGELGDEKKPSALYDLEKELWLRR